MGYILSIDQGTTGSTAALIDDKNLTFIAKSNYEFAQIFPKPSWVEHNLNDIWNSIKKSIEDVLKKAQVSKNDITAIGITNQRETTCVFDSKGNPLHNAIVWQDRRTEDFCLELKKQGKSDLIKEKTGLTLDPYFSSTKMHWLLNNIDLNNQNFYFGTIDTYILFRLTNGKSYKTDATNASRTMLMNLDSGTWDEELCNLFGISTKNLPSIEDSFGQFGKTEGLDFLPDGIPISGILGDQQAALFGQAGLKKGAMKCTYGTGAFMLLNTGKEKVLSKNGLLTTIAYRKNGENIFALEGSTYIAGAAVQWLRDGLKIISSSSEVEEKAKKIHNLDEMKHLIFLPFFTGIGSPYWNSSAKAAIIGMTRDTSDNHICRAVLDSIALSINDLKLSMEQDIQNSIQTLKVDGGAVVNNLLMEIQSQISNCTLVRPEVIETTAYGAAMASAIGSNIISENDIEKLWKEEKRFLPEKKKMEYFDHKTIQWKEIIKKIF